jgi:NitT/TauT family transport system permease protein
MSVVEKPVPTSPTTDTAPEEAAQPRVSGFVPVRETRLKKFTSFVLPPIIASIVFLALWYFFALRLDPDRQFLLPQPHQVVSGGFLDGDAFAEIMASLWLTTQLALIGLLISIVLGIALGLVMYRFLPLERAAYPYLVVLQALPILAITPLMTIAFGYGFNSKLIVVVIISFFPIPTTLLLGLKSVDQGQRDLFRLHHASWWTGLRKLAFPNALPNLFAGLRISAELAVIGAIVGELFFLQGDPGLGLRMYQYRVRIQYEQLYACLIWSSLLGITVFVFFGWLGNRFLRSWHESAQTER